MTFMDYELHDCTMLLHGFLYLFRPFIAFSIMLLILITFTTKEPA